MNSVDLEEWRAVVGYAGLYEVSSCGRLRSLPRVVPCSRGKRTSPGRLIKPQNSTGGYLHACLSKNGVSETILLHRLVAEAFIGQRPENCTEVRHRDGDKTNNRPDNLAWGTHEENESDKIGHGSVANGERNGFSKLSEGQVLEIKARFKRGDNRYAMSSEYGISRCHLYGIGKGARWKHLNGTKELP